MNDYAAALARYLEAKGNNQAELAEQARTTQASISRYATGVRFPSRETAELIDQATSGQVPLSLWIAAATKKFGLAA